MKFVLKTNWGLKFKTFVGLGCNMCFIMCFIFKVYTYLSGTSVSLIRHSYFFGFFLTGPILITIYNILKYLSYIKITYNNNMEINSVKSSSAMGVICHPAITSSCPTVCIHIFPVYLEDK